MGCWRSASGSKMTLNFQYTTGSHLPGSAFVFTGSDFFFQENGHEDVSSLTEKKMFCIMPQSPREIISSTPEVLEGKSMDLSLGEQGAMVIEALTTGSGEQAGPRGALRQSPGGTSREERGQPGLISSSPLSRGLLQFKSQKAGGPKPQDLMAHA